MNLKKHAAIDDITYWVLVYIIIIVVRIFLTGSTTKSSRKAVVCDGPSIRRSGGPDELLIRSGVLLNLLCSCEEDSSGEVIVKTWFNPQICIHGSKYGTPYSYRGYHNTNKEGVQYLYPIFKHLYFTFLYIKEGLFEALSIKYRTFDTILYT